MFSEEEKRKIDTLANYILQKQANRKWREAGKRAQAARDREAARERQATRGSQTRSASQTSHASQPVHAPGVDPRGGTNRTNVRHGKSEGYGNSAPGTNRAHVGQSNRSGSAGPYANGVDDRYDDLPEPLQSGTWQDIFVAKVDRVAVPARPDVSGECRKPTDKMTDLGRPVSEFPSPTTKLDAATLNFELAKFGPELAADDEWIGEAVPEQTPATPPGELTQRQECLIERLLLGNSVAEVAREFGLSRRTLHRWLATPAVAAELRRQQNQLSAKFRNRIATWAARAVGALQHSLKKGNVNTALGLLKGVGMLSGQPLTEIDNHLLAESLAESLTSEPQAGPAAAAASETTIATAESTSPAAQPAICDIPDPLPASFVALEELPVRQQIVIGHLLFGAEPLLAFSKARVRPRLFQQWLREDTAFRQVLRTCRQELQNMLHAQLLQLVPRAMEIIEGELISNNPRVAFFVLRGLGLCGTKKGLQNSRRTA